MGTADAVTFKSAGEAETKDCVKGVTPLTAACKTAKASVTQQTAWKDADTERVLLSQRKLNLQLKKQKQPLKIRTLNHQQLKLNHRQLKLLRLSLPLQKRKQKPNTSSLLRPLAQRPPH